NHYLYTTSHVGKSCALQDGYEFDGVAARVFQTKQPSMDPFYHVDNGATGDNFYTMDVRARDAALSRNLARAIDKGIFARRLCGSTALYGLYNPATRNHFYTIDESEREEAVSDGGYDALVIAGFVLRK
ncbi:hypothetical protein DFH09DRAFT_932361, partial [Mycena vulgaris]